MSDLYNEEIQYHSNSAGTLHEVGKRALDKSSDLPPDKIIHYMGLEINKSDLYSQSKVRDMLERYGAFDQTLDKIRNAYMKRFKTQLIWKYPFSDDMRGGGTIIPVREGFLYLPYSCVFEDAGARYQLDDMELLTPRAAHTLQTEYKAYMDGLCAALCDIESVLNHNSGEDAQNGKV